MSLIKPKNKINKVQQRVSLDAVTIDEINLYMSYVGFSKIDDFIQEACNHVLSKDKEFKEWKMSQVKERQKEEAELV